MSLGAWLHGRNGPDRGDPPGRLDLRETVVKERLAARVHGCEQPPSRHDALVVASSGKLNLNALNVGPFGC